MKSNIEILKESLNEMSAMMFWVGIVIALSVWFIFPSMFILPVLDSNSGVDDLRAVLTVNNMQVTMAKALFIIILFISVILVTANYFQSKRSEQDEFENDIDTILKREV